MRSRFRLCRGCLKLKLLYVTTLHRPQAVAEGRLVGMDNTKKHNTDTANTKKSDRTAFADELNMDQTTNNKNKQTHNK